MQGHFKKAYTRYPPVDDLRWFEPYAIWPSLEHKPRLFASLTATL